MYSSTWWKIRQWGEGRGRKPQYEMKAGEACWEISEQPSDEGRERKSFPIKKVLGQGQWGRGQWYGSHVVEIVAQDMDQKATERLHYMRSWEYVHTWLLLKEICLKLEKNQHGLSEDENGLLKGKNGRRDWKAAVVETKDVAWIWYQ